jgi:hypothetical protein
VFERAGEPAELLRSLRAAFRSPRTATERVTSLSRSIATAGAPAPEAPWNVPISPHRRWEEARLPLHDAKAVKDAAHASGLAAGCSLNDIVLAVCASALRRFLDERDELTDGLVLKAMVPVSVRDVSERGALGNRVSIMPVDLPVGEADPAKRLRAIHESTTAMKESRRPCSVPRRG